MLNLSKDSDDLLYTVSLLHGFYGCYTAELSLKSVQFYGPGSLEFQIFPCLPSLPTENSEEPIFLTPRLLEPLVEPLTSA
jgi:hypothetical protein